MEYVVRFLTTISRQCGTETPVNSVELHIPPLLQVDEAAAIVETTREHVMGRKSD